MSILTSVSPQFTNLVLYKDPVRRSYKYKTGDVTTAI